MLAVLRGTGPEGKGLALDGEAVMSCQLWTGEV